MSRPKFTPDPPPEGADPRFIEWANRQFQRIEDWWPKDYGDRLRALELLTPYKSGTWPIIDSSSFRVTAEAIRQYELNCGVQTLLSSGFTGGSTAQLCGDIESENTIILNAGTTTGNPGHIYTYNYVTDTWVDLYEVANALQDCSVTVGAEPGLLYPKNKIYMIQDIPGDYVRLRRYSLSDFPETADPVTDQSEVAEVEYNTQPDGIFGVWAQNSQFVEGHTHILCRYSDSGGLKNVNKTTMQPTGSGAFPPSGWSYPGAFSVFSYLPDGQKFCGIFERDSDSVIGFTTKSQTSNTWATPTALGYVMNTVWWVHAIDGAVAGVDDDYTYVSWSDGSSHFYITKIASDGTVVWNRSEDGTGAQRTDDVPTYIDSGPLTRDAFGTFGFNSTTKKAYWGQNSKIVEYDPVTDLFTTCNATGWSGTFTYGSLVVPSQDAIYSTMNLAETKLWKSIIF